MLMYKSQPRVRLALVLCMAVCVFAAGNAFSQDDSGQPEAQAPQISQAFCEENPGFGDFDFWVGEWNVYTNNEKRQFAGTNSITKHHANCLVKETWADAAGNGGFSINYYNPVRGEWRQVWVANGYSIDYTGGLNDQGQMVLEGRIDNYGPGNTQKFRGIWTPQENGEVVQRFEALNPETDEWDVWFDGRYVRKESDPNPPKPK